MCCLVCLCACASLCVCLSLSLLCSLQVQLNQPLFLQHHRGAHAHTLHTHASKTTTPPHLLTQKTKTKKGDVRGEVAIVFTCDPANRRRLAEMALSTLEVLQGGGAGGPSAAEVESVR